MTYAFVSVFLACLGLGWAAWRLYRKYERQVGTTGQLREQLRIEELTTRRVCFGAELLGDIESSSGCPMCGAGVGTAREAHIIEEPPERRRANITIHATPRVTAKAVRFEPCGCVWDSEAVTAAGNCLDLVCAVQGNTGRVRFGLATRPIGEAGELVLESVGAPRGRHCE